MLNRFLIGLNRKKAAVCRWLFLLFCLSVPVLPGAFAGICRTGLALSSSQYVLACPYAAEGADAVAHTHGSSCYDEAGALVCALPELASHMHTEKCYREERILVCDREESQGHEHSDACYEEEAVLTCTLPENEGHQHTEACFSTDSGEAVCGMEEGKGAHRHTTECFETARKLVCGLEAGAGAHLHAEACFRTERVLECGQEELPVHVHGEECFLLTELPAEETAAQPTKETPAPLPEETAAPKPEESAASQPEEKAGKIPSKEKASPAQTAEAQEGDEEPEEGLPEKPVGDPAADLETAEIWEKAFEEMTLTGRWTEDLITVAETQLGCRESVRNFEAVLNAERDGYDLKGWTRYGAWYGIPYGDWCAMFLSFCLHYAGIPEEAFPYDCATTTWVRSLTERDLFALASEYDPMSGDIVFFDWEQDGLADHVGLVVGVDSVDDYLLTIEGNHSTMVETFEYALSDLRLMGYGLVGQAKLLESSESPENAGRMEDAVTPTQEAGAEAAEETSENARRSAADEPHDEDRALPATGMPAQHFEKTVAGIRVVVDADEGAFPENTYLSLAPIDGNCIREIVGDAVDGEILEIQAVDITFVNEFGKEIEPLIPIRVSMTVQETQYSAEDTEIVHIDHSGNATTVQQAEDREASGNCELLFDADSFTPYAVVRKAADSTVLPETQDESMTGDGLQEEPGRAETGETILSTTNTPADEDEQTSAVAVGETVTGDPRGENREDGSGEAQSETIFGDGDETVSDEDTPAQSGAVFTERTESSRPFDRSDEKDSDNSLIYDTLAAKQKVSDTALPIIGDEPAPRHWTATAILAAMAMAGSIWLLNGGKRKD